MRMGARSRRSWPPSTLSLAPFLRPRARRQKPLRPSRGASTREEREGRRVWGGEGSALSACLFVVSRPQNPSSFSSSLLFTHDPPSLLRRKPDDPTSLACAAVSLAAARGPALDVLDSLKRSEKLLEKPPAGASAGAGAGAGAQAPPRLAQALAAKLGPAHQAAVLVSYATLL